MPIKMRIVFRDRDGLIKRLRAAGVALPAMLKDALQRGLELVRNRVIDKLSGQVLNVQTGRLWRSINYEIEQTPTKLRGVIGSKVKYAPVHEFGAVITPKRAQFMVFTWKGRRYRARKVIIPKRPYLVPSMEESKANMVSLFEDALGRVLETGSA